MKMNAEFPNESISILFKTRVHLIIFLFLRLVPHQVVDERKPEAFHVVFVVVELSFLVVASIAFVDHKGSKVVVVVGSLIFVVAEGNNVVVVVGSLIFAAAEGSNVVLVPSRIFVATTGNIVILVGKRFCLRVRLSSLIITVISSCARKRKNSKVHNSASTAHLHIGT
jgi:hypothetical protein